MLELFFIGIFVVTGIVMVWDDAEGVRGSIKKN